MFALCSLKKERKVKKRQFLLFNVYYFHSLYCTLEYNISNGQLSDVTGSADVMGRYLANAIVSDKSI